MNVEFFPNPGFAFAFAVALLSGLAAASWFDLKTFKVPKKVSVGLLAAGAVANLIRGVWLGAEGKPVWAFDPGPVLGGIDGLLFALVGFATGFGIFFVLWIFGVCGGGDVKLAAAVGAWVGPRFFIGVLLVALLVVILFTVVRMVSAVFTARKGQGLLTAAKTPQKWRLLTYSLPLTIAVAVILLVGFRTQMGLGG